MPAVKFHPGHGYLFLIDTSGTTKLMDHIRELDLLLEHKAS